MFKRHQIFLLACLCVCQCSFAGHIELDGIIKDAVFNTDGTKADNQSYTCSFYLSLDHERWTIKEAYGDDAQALAFDGTNTYEQVWFAAQRNDTTNSSCGIIRPGSTCVDGSCPTRLVWIAYCAKQLFAESTNGPIISPFSHPSLLGADSMTYSVEWLDRVSGIPKSLKYFFSSNLWHKELKTKLMDENEPNMFLDGDLTAEYHVLSYTNLGGVFLPMEFAMLRYAFDTRSKPHYVLETFQGKILSARQSGQAWAMPPLHRKSWILDFRFSDSSHKMLNVNYQTRGAQWLGTNDPVVTSGLQAAKTNYATYETRYYMASQPRVNPHKGEFAFLAVFGFFILAPLIYLFVLVVKKFNAKSK